MRNRFSPAGQFFVLAMLLFATVVCFPCESWAQNFTFSTLYKFKQSGQSPVSPAGFLIVDSGGNLYGTTQLGGAFGLGTVFEITSQGKLSVLHSFQGSPNDGNEHEGIPVFSGLARDTAGNLYGATGQGGTFTAPCTGGCGVVFKLSPSGTETILHNFAAYAEPSNLILDSQGNLYGTTAAGGAFNAGTVYQIKGGTFSVLYNFCPVSGCAGGATPTSGVVRDAAGNLYGVTAEGGISNQGTVFKVTPSGIETVLHSFPGSPTDGIDPEGNLKQDNMGNVYGTTPFGGPNNGGVLFKQPKDGEEETIVYNFFSLANGADDYAPIGPVQIDKSGNFYGIATGTNGGPVVWEVTSAGVESILHTFAPGVGLAGALVIDSKGNLYGTTTGQASVPGSVFKLTLAK
jgi:uncharacterized repeat protein (TIGR03803 family)